MATNIPPHNLRELAQAINYLIDNYDRAEDIPNEELLQFIPGPDFPTGGVIVGTEGIHAAYSTGRGRIVLRGLAHIEEMNSGRFRIVITEIPYQLNKSNLLERIADLVREEKIPDISDLRDESDRRGMSVIIELKRAAQPKKVLNQLYKYTPLQSTFGVQLLALIEGEPRLLTLKRCLQVFIEHRQQVITRRTQFELDKARARAHILDGLLIALANLDAVIDTIRKSPDAEAAKERLMTRFKLSELQAQAILDMQLRRLAALERQKIENEHREVLARISFLEDLLANPKKILGMIQADLAELVEKYGDERRTHIAAEAKEDFEVHELVPDEAVLISITQRGYIKRVAAKAFRAQSRGGRGVTGMAPKEEDEVLTLIPARTLDNMLFFSNKGKVYSEKVYQIPDADRAAKGIPIVNVLSLDANEFITAAVAVPASPAKALLTDGEAAGGESSKDPAAKASAGTSARDFQYCILTTLNGRVKRLDLAELTAVRPSGIIAITLEEGDSLGWARLTHGTDEIILVTEQGQALRFKEDEVRPMGRSAAGVTGMRLSKGDHVASMEVVEPQGFLVLITTKGYGKRSPLSEYPAKSRATGGVASVDRGATPMIGTIAAARVVQTDDDLTIISAGGVVLRMPVKHVRQAGRATRGVRLMEVDKGDRVASLARIVRVGEEG
jgi:DNA gyrase subunit A